MLEAQKKIISDISYDKNLFRKEVIKTLVWSKTSEKNDLKNWLSQNFGDSHQSILSKVFEVVKDVY